MRSSRPNAMVPKYVLTKRKVFTFRDCNYLDFNNYWKALFQNLKSLPLTRTIL